MNFLWISIFTVALLLPTSELVAQDRIKSRDYVDGSVAIGVTQGTLSVAVVHDWLLGKRNKFIVGLGGRFTGYQGRNQYYVTAPAKLTSNGTGPLVIFRQNVTANMDTFLIAKPNVYSFNAIINLGYQFNDKFSVGFNIDFIGFSLGSQKQGTYINGNKSQMTNASVSPFNLLLVSDNDLGTLNSELCAKYVVGENWAIRSGLQFLFTEYTTETHVQQYPELNDRFRKKTLMFLFGTTFNLR